jgi:hypothetical protein
MIVLQGKPDGSDHKVLAFFSELASLIDSPLLCRLEYGFHRISIPLSFFQKDKKQTLNSNRNGHKRGGQ